MTIGAVKTKERRYQLWRIWNPQKPLLLFVLLNPSRADHLSNDKTVTRLISFTKKFGYGGFYLGNICSYICPYPSELEGRFYEKDYKNILHLRQMHQKCEKVIFGWGNHGHLPAWLKEMIPNPMCMGINKNGSPKHPLYLPKATELLPYESGKQITVKIQN
jgi:hypothetical protein